MCFGYNRRLCFVILLSLVVVRLLCMSIESWAVENDYD